MSEVEKKNELHALMKKFKKKHYERDGIVIDLVNEEETVRVKIKKKKDENGEEE